MRYAGRTRDRDVLAAVTWTLGAGRTRSLERSADQDLLRRADVRQCAVDTDRVARDAEAAHVVRGHRAGAAMQRDGSHGAEVERDPELRAVREVHILDLDGQKAEAAAAAE